MVGLPSSFALLGGFAIGTQVLLLSQHGGGSGIGSGCGRVVVVVVVVVLAMHGHWHNK